MLMQSAGVYHSALHRRRAVTAGGAALSGDSWILIITRFFSWNVDNNIQNSDPNVAQCPHIEQKHQPEPLQELQTHAGRVSVEKEDERNERRNEMRSQRHRAGGGGEEERKTGGEEERRTGGGQEERR
ncbi:hypothetical protein EYF80_057428 [Liparis tanakae]|uniref:Uncharacterized protein n=1 Tax=Liparis tanakae TaxID=230148 RepID=A0A4Z2EW01_9TELE|nr:hypothetical protein EYF80_057428 [Liparis tanakae]